MCLIQPEAIVRLLTLTLHYRLRPPSSGSIAIDTATLSLSFTQMLIPSKIPHIPLHIPFVFPQILHSYVSNSAELFRSHRNAKWITRSVVIQGESLDIISYRIPIRYLCWCCLRKAELHCAVHSLIYVEVLSWWRIMFKWKFSETLNE